MINTWQIENKSVRGENVIGNLQHAASKQAAWNYAGR